jgi:hypothetical protein
MLRVACSIHDFDNGPSHNFEKDRLISLILCMFYNSKRQHQSLDRRTPDDVYWSTLPQMQVVV